MAHGSQLKAHSSQLMPKGGTPGPGDAPGAGQEGTRPQAPTNHYLATMIHKWTDYYSSIFF